MLRELAGSIEIFVALGQVSRWKLFLLLLHAGPDGLSRTALNRDFGFKPSALSSHLGALEKAGLITVAPGSRKVSADWGQGVATITVDYEQLASLIGMAIEELREHAPDVLDEALAPARPRSLAKGPTGRRQGTSPKSAGR